MTKKSKPAKKRPKAPPVKRGAARKAPAKAAKAAPKSSAGQKKPPAKGAAKTARPAVKSRPKATPAARSKAAVKEKVAKRPVAKAAAALPKKIASALAAAPVKVGKDALALARKAAEKAQEVLTPAAEPAASKANGKKQAKAEAKAPIAAAAFPALDASVKRPAKPFFIEVKPGVERVIKRGDKSAATSGVDIQARRKGPATEESPEELAERIERELQSQSFLKRNRMRPQLCTKCGINAVTPRFTIDRELGYCELCAEILHLGETKEARRMELNLTAKKDEDDPLSPEAAAEEVDEEPVPEDLD